MNECGHEGPPVVGGWARDERYWCRPCVITLAVNLNGSSGTVPKALGYDVLAAREQDEASQRRDRRRRRELLNLLTETTKPDTANPAPGGFTPG